MVFKKGHFFGQKRGQKWPFFDHFLTIFLGSKFLEKSGDFLFQKNAKKV